jgi:hypothetical protein
MEPIFLNKREESKHLAGQGVSEPLSKFARNRRRPMPRQTRALGLVVEKSKKHDLHMSYSVP